MINIINDYWQNFDRTYLGKRWSVGLIDHVDKALNENDCDHTFKFTNQYFNNQRNFFKRILHLWLLNHNCCDCEVVINLDWRKGLDWRNEPEPYKINYSKRIQKYKDGTVVDLRFYGNGLQEGDVLKLKKDKTIETADGKTLSEFQKGDEFRVLMKDPSISNNGRVQLVSLTRKEKYNLLSYDDNNEIFNELELIPRNETL